ncbi:MAG: SUMF1/EgtB/PvdO family nonheme iron enzyme [Saprospiraceae bacterium]
MAENQALKTFIIYARDDKAYKDQLLRHLRPLVSSGYLSVWHDGDILPGEDWERKIKANLKTSQLVLVLVSVNCLNSDFIEGEELETAVSQLNDGHTRIVPIIISPCGWRFHKLFVGLQGLPEDMKPVSNWADPNQAWTDVVESLAKIVEETRAEQAETAKKQRETEEQNRLALLDAERAAQQKAEQSERERIAQKEREREMADQKRKAEAEKQALADLAARQAHAEQLRLEQEAERKRLRQEAKNNASDNSPTIWVGLGTVVILALVLMVWKPWKDSNSEFDPPKSEQKKDPSATTPSNPQANMVLVRGGTFQMGSTEGTDEQPIHSVTVSDFYMSKYEVTNAEFVKFLNVKGNQTEGGKTWIDLDGKWEDEKCRIYQSGNSFKVESGYENYPVIYVSWYGATAYCQWLGSQYRLPTEAEWEYAAGNGSRHTKYSWGNGDPSGKKGGNVSDQTAKAKFSYFSAFENYTDGYIYTAPVGQFDANDFGLYDMSGNVWEWCSDWYDEAYYKNSPSKDPKGPTTAKDYRVLRGGSWGDYPENCRVASRLRNYPNARFSAGGFRVVRGY